VKYAFIRTEAKNHAVTCLCRVLAVSRSAYYDWIDRPPSQRQVEDNRLAEKIKISHENSRENYGTRRIRDDLLDDAEIVSRERISRLMKQEGLKSKHRKKFRITTNSNHRLPISANLLKRQFDVEQPDQAYVTDITYVWTSEGWLYLAVMIDLFSRLVVGWSLSNRITSDLVTDALGMAILKRRTEPGLIVHSDRGAQYASTAFRKQLEDNGFQSSMSRKGDCWDNAVAESFFKTLKCELVYHQRYRYRSEARLDIFEYIEAYYNRQRKHSSNGYMSPLNYEKHWQKAA
jgi:transposase InsO family protein